MHAAARTRPRAPEFVDPPGYARHRPETTLLYQLVEQNYRAFREQRAMAGRAKLERLCRYVSRPPLAVERLALTASGQVRYLLKTPYRDGTTHIVLEPQDLMARLAALVPPPRMHLTRYHGVFAPHSSLRAAITPAQRGKGRKHAAEGDEQPAVPCPAAMTWAQRLKRVFGIEIDRCARCQGKLKVLASIEDPAVIARILTHLDRTSTATQPELAPQAARAPPPPPRQSALL